MTALEGGRCRLRPFTLADAGALVRHGNDREIARNLRDRFPSPYTRADADAWLALVTGAALPSSLAIDVAGEAVGSVGLMLHDDVERYSAEIGYWLGRAHWGRGIMSDAVRLATTYAFSMLSMRRVFAMPFTRNIASCRVLERAGYVREGTLRHSAVKDGELLDQHMYAAYADRWPVQG